MVWLHALERKSRTYSYLRLNLFLLSRARGERGRREDNGEQGRWEGRRNKGDVIEGDREEERGGGRGIT